MPREPLPPTAVAISFIDCINRGDLDGLSALMTDDHTLAILDEPPLVGCDANRNAWHGYFSSFPDYVIHPRYITAIGTRVAVLGSTTGSHLALPDEQELELDVVWIAEAVGGRLSRWTIAEPTPEVRNRMGIPPTA